MYKPAALIEHALAIDPAYARAYAKLSETHTVAYMEPIDGDYMSRPVLDHAYSLANKAVQLGPNLPFAHAALGWALLWKGEHDAAINATEHALDSQPRFQLQLSISAF